MDARGAFNHWLAFAAQGEVAVMAIVSPELTNDTNYDHILTTPDKNAAFAWGCKNDAILTIINVDISCDIEDEVKTSFAVINVELLSF